MKFEVINLQIKIFVSNLAYPLLLLLKSRLAADMVANIYEHFKI